MAGTDLDSRPKLYLKRIYAATPQRVWQAWIDPQALKHWFSPDPSSTMRIADIDLRVGGRYRFVFDTGDQVHDVSGTYREVDAPRRLAFTWAWSSTPERESLVTVEIVPVTQGAELHFRHEQFFDSEARDRHEQGWSAIFVRLEQYLGQTDAH
jgi:uncharacterized protein YndB with AHSA1/START domain